MSDPSPSGGQKLKVVVWDLDHTVWDGVLSEGDSLTLRPGVRACIEALDARGVLQSVASRNDHGPAWTKLVDFGLAEYFLAPQINWGPKSESIKALAQKINVGLDTFALIDDQPFERDEVAFSLPAVRVYDAGEIATLLARDEFMPRFVTADSRERRILYQRDFARQEAETNFSGANDAFLATLDMTLRVAPAEPGDLERVEELTLRTHQLNTTGKTFSHAELEALRRSAGHRLLVAELDDRFGGYGKIGLVLLATTPTAWRVELFLMSCRVMSRGVGGALITWLRQEAKAAGVALQAHFIETDRNRMMYVTYRFAGFEEIAEENGVSLLDNDLSDVPELPGYFAFEGRLTAVKEMATR